MRFNIANPTSGAQKRLEVNYDQNLRAFYDKRVSQEVNGDALGEEFKEYVSKIMGGCDKQGFPMKQGVLTPGRVRLVLHRASDLHTTSDVCFAISRLNVWRGYKGVEGTAGAGGLIRNTSENCLWTFEIPIVRASSIFAEAEAALQGVKIIVAKNMDCNEVELDCKYLYQLIVDKNQLPPLDIRNVIIEIRELIEKIQHCKIRWIYRECNAVADSDSLAKR